MKTSLKVSLIVLSLSFLTLLSYVSWLDSTTVKIIAVHQEENFSEVLVKNYPITNAGKIKWWLKNKELLKNKYNIPRPGSNDNFYINFWDFGEGYKKLGKYDRRCFADMKPPKNCIDKNAVFSVENGRDGSILFTVYNGTYRMERGGRITKTKE
ncbi:DUF943 family protein [Enterobacter sp. DE0047]|uniref:DUF943 family protein n=1 Tax=Enterobacter sp. DE0047 TaxID=2584949 RepID=UPI00119E8D34|nr:DUF943 family protein [Enterobacter sp. DE0047]